MEYCVTRSKKLLALAVLLLLSLNVAAQSRGLEISKSDVLSDAMYVVVNNPGELQSKIPESMVSAIRRLKVEGTLSKDDLVFLRRLAFRSSLKDAQGNGLEPFFDLDLLNANIFVGGLLGVRTYMIPDHFLNGSRLLRRIYLPENIERIGDAAFEGCENLREVSMPMSVKFIGSRAFKGCGSLTDIVSPKSLNTIEDGCFEDCGNLHSFALFDGLTKIGNTAFKNTAIMSVRIPETVNSIGDEAFANTAIESINLPDGLQTVNARAFEGCKRLQFINVSPQNSRFCTVDNVLFNKQKTVLIRVPVVKSGLFKIPDGVTEIQPYAFSECDKIVEVQFPKSLVRIGEAAFRNCRTLSKAEPTASIQSIGKSAFAGTWLVIVDVSGVKQLGEETFAGCEKLIEVKLPMLEQLPASIFENCSSLPAIQLPKALKGIGKNAFKGCKKLAKIEFPQTLTTIDDEAFVDCLSLESVDFPMSVTTIGHKSLYGCKNLKSVTAPWKEPLKIKDFANSKATVLHVPFGSEELYKKAKGWKHFKLVEPFMEIK